MTALDLIKQGWCQGQSNKRSGFLFMRTSHCAISAISKVYGLRTPATFKAIKKVEDVVGCSFIIRWNDDPARTHEEVIAAFEKARV